ncbi:MAG: FecR family protein [Steroidobacteraceae bacterium]
MSRASDISDAAAQWLVRIEAGQASAQTWDALQAWMDADPRHRAAFIRLRVGWNRIDRLKNLRPVDGTINGDLLARKNISPSKVLINGLQPLAGTPRKSLEDLLIPQRRHVLATAAAIAAVGVFAWIGSYHFGWKSYETGVGGREKIELTDGTTVDLNTNTELDARITDRRRDIMLTRGEALFHVAHDAKRPFYVVAGGTVVRAVGTSFSVRIRDSEHVEVLVAEGRVAVGAPGTEANFENPSLLATAPKVSAGEAASVRRKSVAVRSVQPQDVTRKLAWTAGYLSFQGETLDDMVQEFNRYNQRHMSISDPSIAKIQFGGTFSTTDPDSFIAALQSSFGIRVQVEGRNGDIRLFAGSKPP